MSLLGLDIGEKRVGVAISRSRIIARPLETINFDQDFFKRLEEICQREKVKKIILGLPKNFKNKKSQQEKKIKQVAAEIKKKLKLKIVFMDESFTTKTAQERGAKDLDQEAAVIILEDYLDRRGN